MTPATPAEAALLRLATLTPGLQAAAILDEHGDPVAGDASLAAAAGGSRDGVVAVRRGALTAAARTAAPVLEGLLRADLEAVLAAVAPDRSA